MKGTTENLIRFDWAAKRMLRDKANFEVLEGLLSELLKRDVTILEILESESNKVRHNDKHNRVDVKARLDGGEIVIIEVQNLYEMDFLHRVLYGISKAVTEQLSEGDPYRNVEKVYSISIVYFKIGDGSDYIYHGDFDLRGMHSNTSLVLNKKEQEALETKRETAREIFPECYVISVNDFNSKAKNTLDEWIEYLKTSRVPEGATAKGLDKVREKLKFDAMSPAELKEYRAYLDDMTAQRDSIARAKSEGRDEARLQIAANLKKQGLPIEVICAATGLSPDQIS